MASHSPFLKRSGVLTHIEFFGLKGKIVVCVELPNRKQVDYVMPTN